jgi:threonine dehydrogenase-like Zn-dependent dehydrogenase
VKAAVFHEPGDIRVEDVPDPKIEQPTDAIVRITRIAICGSDLWFYRGHRDYKPGWRTGHEPMGIVEDVGGEVWSLEAGDRVLPPSPSATGPASSADRGCTPPAYMGMSGPPSTTGPRGRPSAPLRPTARS